MDGTEPFKPFIESVCYGSHYKVEIQKVGNVDSRPGRGSNVYRLKIEDIEDFYEVVQRLKAFYGDKIRFGYAFPMGMRMESNNCHYVMAEVDEPEVIPGHNMIRFAELMKRNEQC